MRCLIVVIRAARETGASVERCSAGLPRSVSAMQASNNAPSRARRVPTSPGASLDSASSVPEHPTLQVHKQVALLMQRGCAMLRVYQ